MARSSRSSRRPGLLSLAAVAALALGSAVALPSTPVSASTPTTSQGGAASVSHAHAVAVGQSVPANLSSATAGSPRRRLPVLRPQSAGRALALTRSRAVPPAAVSAGVAGPTVLHSFDGVSALDNKAASGFDLEPPDEGLAAGNGFVVNFVNVTGRILSTSGAHLGTRFYLNPFFHESPDANTSDPRVFYDAGSQRWIATILGYSFDNSTGLVAESHIDVATSRTSDPRGAWRVVRFDASNPNHSNCPCLADYPILGVDSTNIYVSTNEFDKTLTGFNGSQLYAISKRQLETGATNPAIVLYGNLSVAGTLAYHVQPANTYGSPGVEYLMSSLDPNSTFDNRLAVWALTNPSAVSSGGTPTLSVRVISSEAYGFPPDAQTPPGFCSGSACGSKGAPTTGVVGTDFDAMQEVQYINGVLVGALNTGVTVPGDTASRSGVAWFVVRPHVSGTSISSTTHVERQGYVAQNGEYLLYPHINMTQNGAMAMTFGFGGPSTFLSAAYATAPAGGTFGRIRIAGAGVAPDNGFTGTEKFGGVGRWGDYSNGEIIPGTNKVWLATQYIPNNGDGNANWGNRIFELQLG